MASYSAGAAASNIVELSSAHVGSNGWGSSPGAVFGFRDDADRHADGSLLTNKEYFIKYPSRVLRFDSAASRAIADAGIDCLPPNHVALFMTEREGQRYFASLLVVPRDSVPVINVAGDCSSMRELARAIAADSAGEQGEYLLRPARCFRLVGPGRWEERFPAGRPSASLYAWHAKNAQPSTFSERVHCFSLHSADIVSLPKREWLAERALKRGLVSQIIAPGSAGKSLLTLQWAVAVALGRGEFTGLSVRERARVLIVNLEDDLAEQHLRLAAVAAQFGITLEELHGWIHIYNPGEQSAFRIAKREDKRIVEGDDVEAILEFAAENEIGLIIFDPLVELNEADENNNTEMGAVMSVFKKIARTANAAVLFVHHTRKLDRAASDGHAGNVDSGRGASSIPNATRITITLYNMSGSEAKALGIPDLERNRYVRLDDAKANQFLASGQAKWFKRTSVDLPNGEQVGVLVPSDLGANNRTAQCQLLATRIMVAALEAGRKLSPSKQASNSAAAYCVENRGDSDFTKAEFTKALAALCGFDFDVEEYASGGKTAERYVLVGHLGRFADGSGLDG